LAENKRWVGLKHSILTVSGPNCSTKENWLTSIVFI